MSPEVSQGTEDAEGFLDAEEAVEGPFAVELDDGVAGLDAGGGDDVLAGVVAFAGAVPEEESMEERNRRLILRTAVLGFADLLGKRHWSVKGFKSSSVRACNGSNSRVGNAGQGC
jgi:hypothetical protein